MSWKVLIANRGEIALRILRSCHALGYETVVCHSEADSNSLAVRLADEHLCIGPASATHSYLDKAQILRAAELTGADAIHPGYGFLSENAEFAEQVEASGFIFIGPESRHIRLMGDKHQALETAKKHGLPTVPGSEGLLGPDLIEVARCGANIGYPLLIKAASGGGGKGIKLIESAEQLIEALPLMRTEAVQCYGNTDLYLEKYLRNPRHIEVQILGDGHGGSWHFGLRDCSVQRRHQKILEEASPLNLDPKSTEKLLEQCCRFIQEIEYRGLGTLEFLYTEGAFFFIEMNTRIQVEHPITEMITGHDLVQLQLQLLKEGKLPLRQSDITMTGHALECRINAEDPQTFHPCPGTVIFYHPPGGFGVRVDSAIYQGDTISPYYDSMIAKIITHAPTRGEAIAKMRVALNECVIDGITTNIELHKTLLEHPDFIQGGYSTTILERVKEVWDKTPA